MFSEITREAIEVWASLPEKIREDPLFIQFHQEYERMNGAYF